MSLMPGESSEGGTKSQESKFALTSVCFPRLLKQGICKLFPMDQLLAIWERIFCECEDGVEVEHVLMESGSRTYISSL